MTEEHLTGAAFLKFYQGKDWRDHTPDKPSLHTQGSVLSECCRERLHTYPNPDELASGVDGERFACLDCGRRWYVVANEESGNSWRSNNKEPELLYGGPV